MKKTFCLIFLIFISKVILSQSNQEIDSLNNVLNTSTQDTAKVMALCALSGYEQDNEKRLSLLNKALVLTRKIEFEKGEALCFGSFGNYFISISDFPKALEYHLKALKIREKLNETEGIVISLTAIGQVYSQQRNDEVALAYNLKALEVLKQINIPDRWALLYLRISGIYLRQNKLDSALIYCTKSYENVSKAPNPLLNFTLTGLGNVHTAMGNTELGFTYYRMSISNAIKNNNKSNLDRSALANSYLALAKLFAKTNNKDSAIYYAKQTLTLRTLGQHKDGVMQAAKLLSELYKNKDDKEAFRYLELAMEAQDSIFSGSNTAQFQSLTFSEQERQREINEARLKDSENRKNNLQFAAIAVGLITFIILFLVLSRSIIVKTKFIEFFSVLGLLAVFEFINLFIHPYLAHVTHDSPVLMLSVLISIGALLIPLHHKLEKWTTKKLVEKNKQIRLANARKTIQLLSDEQLESGGI